MLRIVAATFLALVNFSICVAGQVSGPVDYVNPLVGTQSTYELSNGNTYPAIAHPWGMNFWTPQTGIMGDGWQYTYDANKIKGFKQTHQPSPWINDYGQFSIMAVSGAPLFEQNERASWFSHKAETVTPYYYKVYLADHDIVAELAPTERAAVFRFTFPEDSSYVVIDAFDRNSSVKIDTASRRITGYSTRNSGGVPDNFRNYFVVEFDRPFEYVATFSNDAYPDGPEAHVEVTLKPGKTESKAFHTGAVVGFKTRRGEQVTARVASSFVSPEQAALNLEREVGGRDLESVATEGRDRWNDVLSRIEIEDNDIDRKRTFYSCLYRSLLFPRKFYEIDGAGKTIHYSPYSGNVCDGYMYTDTGLWDTFRCLFPLLNLLYPSQSLEMQEGLLNAYRESGYFPEWASPGHRSCMVGNNSASVLADAYLKGIRVEDTATLWEGVTRGANSVHPRVPSTGRLGYGYYNAVGYVPCDVKINESAARTLEYAYDDWCISQLGKALGRSDSEIETYATRAGNYRNLFDKSTGLMRGRNLDGTFSKNFSPLKWGGDFTEGNSWHYTWSVFHDPRGLMDLMGGKATFVSMLDSVFNVPPVFDDSYYGFPIHEIREMQVVNMGNYAHGNQPAQHMIYLYNYAGQPWKAQYWIRQVLDRLYTATPDGYCGDEDNGQTSAWYVFSALGFYPVAPGTDQYVLGAPLFKKATLNFEDGSKFVVNAPQNSDTNYYIDRIDLNGADLQKNYITHSQLQSGGIMDVRMSATPNKLRGTLEADAPYSMSSEKQKH